MMSLKQTGKLALLTAGMACTGLTSCKEETTETYTGENPFIMTLSIEGSDGSFSYYTVPFEDVMEGTLSAVGQGVEQVGYFTYNQIDDAVYSMGGFGDNSITILEQNEAGELVTAAGNASFDNGINDIVKADDGKLVAIEMDNSSDQVTLHIVDKTSATPAATVKTPVADITSYEGPSYSGMVVSGNYVYVSFYISDPATYATDYTDMAQVAVFSYPSLELVKVMTDTRVGPIGGFGTHSGLIKDENGNVYALSHSNPANGYSQTTKPGGILRINNGETSFDQDYFFDIEAVTSGLNTAHLIYLGGNKVFAEINQQKNAEQARWSDGPLKPAVLDLSAKTVNYIANVPEHAGTGRKLASSAVHDNKYVYMGVEEADAIYVYKMDTENFTAVKGAKVEASFVAGFYKF